ncbi:hypothetical protein AAFO92_02635 [Roseovarius sp. CAU 1744]|uniref:hypothetical protein n=1 Tax=Roseovarius sp. CAU 1744 TaxID=3140368 RepID=UPI00325C0245
MRTRFLYWLIAVIVTWTGTAQAQASLNGATELWLQGDDRQSLPALAELARGGNSDARLLLGRIETNDLGPSPYRMSLSKLETRALFRDISDHGLFGRTWISVEAALDNELARVFQRALQPVPRLGLIERLHRIGEIQAADHPTRILALYGTREMREKLRTADYLMPDLIPYLEYVSGPPEPRADGMAALRHIAPDEKDEISASDPDSLGMAGLLSLGFGYGGHEADNRWRPAVENWLLSAPSTQPIADLCNESCGQQPGDCAIAFLALTGGYYEVIRIDSPLERLIPQDRFLGSPRARLMVLRRAALARTEAGLTWLADHEDIAEISDCAADLVVNERRNYARD